MKTYINKTIYAVLLLFITVACSDYLDVNENPNNLSSTDQPKIILPTIQVDLANTLMGWDFGFGGGFWSEYWTQSYTASQFKTLCEYKNEDFDNAYLNLTSGVLKNAEEIKRLSTEEKNNGYKYIAEAISIFAWQVATDVWGNIPYSEALKGDEGIFNPKTEDGQEIYIDLQARVDTLLNTDITTLTSIEGKYDFIFKGNFEKWEAFLNSLKLKLMMRQSETKDYDNDAVVTFIKSGATFLEESAKISGSIWNDSQEGKRHPMREFQEGGANTISTNVIASKNFIDYLKENDDPRLEKLFSKPDGGYLGAFFGDFASKVDSDRNGTTDNKETYSTPTFAANMDIMILSAWEVDFFIAEAYARADDLPNAKMYYDKGVEASLSQHGITATDIISSGYATWVDGTREENIKQIAMQRWVANANYQHIESFIDRNRTKYPSVNDIDIEANRQDAFTNFPVGDLTISVAGRQRTNGNLPASAMYSDALITRNSNAPDQKKDLLEKIWWDQKSGK